MVFLFDSLDGSQDDCQWCLFNLSVVLVHLLLDISICLSHSKTGLGQYRRVHPHSPLTSTNAITLSFDLFCSLFIHTNKSACHPLLISNFTFTSCPNLFLLLFLFSTWTFDLWPMHHLLLSTHTLLPPCPTSSPIPHFCSPLHQSGHRVSSNTHALYRLTLTLGPRSSSC